MQPLVTPTPATMGYFQPHTATLDVHGAIVQAAVSTMIQQACVFC